MSSDELPEVIREGSVRGLHSSLEFPVSDARFPTDGPQDPVLEGAGCRTHVLSLSSRDRYPVRSRRSAPQREEVAQEAVPGASLGARAPTNHNPRHLAQHQAMARGGLPANDPERERTLALSVVNVWNRGALIGDASAWRTPEVITRIASKQTVCPPMATAALDHPVHEGYRRIVWLCCIAPQLSPTARRYSHSPHNFGAISNPYMAECCEPMLCTVDSSSLLVHVSQVLDSGLARKAGGVPGLVSDSRSGRTGRIVLLRVRHHESAHLKREATREDRTPDLPLTRRMLYRLS